MHRIRREGSKYIIELSRQELAFLSNSVNEVANGISIDAAEFEVRLGVSKTFATRVLADIRDALSGGGQLGDPDPAC